MLATSPTTIGYLPVATATLCPATVMACDLFAQRKNSPFVELYKSSSYPITDEDIARLRETGVRQLYVRLEDADEYRAYLCEHVLHDPNFPVAARLMALREVTRVVFDQATARDDCDEMVHASVEFGRGLAATMTDNSLLFRELFQIVAHDYYTFTHICNVSIYSVMLAKALGETDPSRLSEIAAAGLLHDIGKRHIPARILNKAGKLAPAEWDQIKRHPTDGYLELAPRQDLNWGQLMMVYQHHERLDGSGYPAGIRGEEIHPWARICAIADVFDAMTCQRPYRPAIPLEEVSDHLTKRAGTWFDKEGVACWLAHIGSKQKCPT